MNISAIAMETRPDQVDANIQTLENHQPAHSKTNPGHPCHRTGFY